MLSLHLVRLLSLYGIPANADDNQAHQSQVENVMRCLRAVERAVTARRDVNKWVSGAQRKHYLQLVSDASQSSDPALDIALINSPVAHQLGLAELELATQYMNIAQLTANILGSIFAFVSLE